jgi:hypothetical protein
MTFTQTVPTDSSSDSTTTSANHNPTVETALGYHNWGCAVTPVKHGEKKAYLPGWTKARLTEPEIRKHFAGRPVSVGVAWEFVGGTC